MSKNKNDNLEVDIEQVQDYRAKAKELKAGVKALKEINKKKSKISKLEKEKTKLMKKIGKKK
ncbi:MAG: hypothetical protein ACM3X7_01590 [Solirubrobacterales bacterium]